ncbi:MAG: hypothetical protein OEP45_03225, partial [Acidobacteriota bacterium]|nr:hypothetical protein [Acidobacteriota bacterium]
MTENPARSEAAVVEAAPGPRWFYTLELPALQLRAGEVTAANGRAVELFGDRVVGGAFDERFSALAHVAAPSKETGEGASRKVRALAGPAAGR